MPRNNRKQFKESLSKIADFGRLLLKRVWIPACAGMTGLEFEDECTVNW
jgi:hypothetical protein